MAFLEFHYYSKALDKITTVNVILPERVKDSRAYKHMIETLQFQPWCPDYPDILAADAEMRKENDK